ncbi:MAG: MFS transporter [Gammaproteobacteria bacterium]|nr:MFS transporter [Gammaproteobacteria bacterium]
MGEPHVDAQLEASQYEEFKVGWPLLSAVALGVGLGMSPLPFYTLGVLAGPIMADFGWSLGDVFLAFPIYTITAVIMSPLIGALADRYGARRICLISIVLFGLAMMAQSLHTGNIVIWAILWGIISIFGAGTLPVTFTRALNNAFEQHRGKALGIALIATGMFGTLAKYFAQEVTALTDWRVAYIGLGLLPILIALPLSALSLRDVTDTPANEAKIINYKILVLVPAVVGFAALAWLNIEFILPQVTEVGWKLEHIIVIPFLLITGLPIAAFLLGKISTIPILRANKSTSIEFPGLTFSQSLGEWRLWVLVVAIVPISFALGATIPNLEQLLGARNFSVAEAVGLAGLTGLAVLAGRLIGGYLIDRFWSPGVAFVFLASPAFAFYLLSAPDVSAVSARVAILMIGFGAGVEYDFLAYLVSKYFGMRSYSAIYGFLYAFFALGAGFGPKLMADAATSYSSWEEVMLFTGVLIFIGSLPLLTLGKYRSFENPT